MYSILICVKGIPASVVENGFASSLDALNYLAKMYPEMKMILANRLYKIARV